MGEGPRPKQQPEPKWPPAKPIRITTVRIHRLDGKLMEVDFPIDQTGEIIGPAVAVRAT